jgi:hypothetical protein
MKRVFVEGWLLLFYCDCLMHLRGFQKLHNAVRGQEVMSASRRPESAYLCRAADLASVFYFKRVKCLQRSAATVLLLRRHGWNAELLIGVKLMPFQSHAWVEIDGAVVNDRPYIKDVFPALARY